MEYQELYYYLKNVGKDPSALVFEDELTGLYNRRFCQSYLLHKIDWDSLENHHLSLLMMDIDYFKQVNDTYGHDTGDQALVHVAHILKDISIDVGIPIRYGGDEFIILLPEKGKEAAIDLGEQLIRKLHENPLPPKDTRREVFLTLSIGAATAPCDAGDRKTLLQKADAALYFAKQLGRDRVADVAAAAAEEIFPKTAIQQLEKSKIAGRRTHLAQVADNLKRFSRGESRFMIVEGAAGMGKSSFLQTVQRNLERSSIALVSISGTPQELFRPYYLISNMIVELMNRREDKGKAVLDTMSPEEINALSLVLPPLMGGKIRVFVERKSQREEIFRSLLRFVHKLVNSLPFMVFVDDLHFADEASLLLFHSIISQARVPMFLCCASSDFQRAQIEINPLERFWQAYGEELDIRKIPLTPLSGKDIAEHLEGIFPSFAMPANFEMELAEITQGNPLFLSEILSKLVHDQKIVLTGQQWTVRSLEQNYLPTSLDEIISEKIALFDEESRRILDHASTFGESVSLSMLTGSSQIMESHVLDFLDKATAYGLVSSDFRFDDDNIRFLSKRVQEFVYGSIQQEKKEKLHEKIALYQEKLFEQRLLPSAAILAWHFTRSANLEKARIYEQQHTQYNSTLFVVEEAVNYIGDGDAPTSDIPLNASSLIDLPHFFRSLLSALRGTKLYPAGSKARIDALRQIRVVLDRILADRSHLRIAADKDSLIVNGEAIDTSEFKSIADQFRNLFISVDLSSVTIRKDCSERDMDAMLEAIGMVDRRKIHPQFWEEVCEERGLTGIELKQVRYARVDTEDGEQEEPMVPAMQDGEAMLQAMQGIEYGLCSADLASIFQVIGSLMGAHSKIKLYPMESSVITDAISQVMTALDEFLSTRPFLTLAAVDASLLVNGVKVDTQNFEALAASFVRFLQSIRLNSVTFLEHVSSKDVVTFLKTVLQHTTSELSTEFWRRFTREMKITGILFDRSFYTVMEEMTAGVAEENPAENEMREDFDSVPDQEISGAVESFQDMQKDPSADDLAGTLKDLFLRGEEKQLSLFLKMTFQNYVLMPPSHRKHLAEACQKALSPGEFVPIPRFLRLIAEHLQGAIEKEEDPNILELLAILLQQMSFSFLQYGEYSLASWLFVIIKERFRELGESGSGQYHLLSQTIREPLPPHALAGLWDDMRSTVPALQQEATLFLSSMDERILPLLIDVTKKENDLRVRQLMAGLIGKLGIEAADTFKRELVLEVAAEERVRMLDVADMVSRDLHVELSYALTDEKTQARRAAFRLAERLQDEQTVELLCDYAQAEDGDKAIPAIRSLGRMKAAQAVSVLIAVLNKTSDHDVQMACCQSLGQIADPACMDMLIRILTPRGLLSLQKKYSDNLRATAAFALSQIPHPRVLEVMKSFSEDNDLRIRRTARAVLTGGTGQPSRKE